MPDTNDKTTADAPSLADNEYHLIVAPVLQVAAELAAVRGDPELFNDMPSMLALKTLVKRLGQLYLAQHPDTDASLREAIESAPEGACAMALKRAELDEVQSTECMWSLNEAARQLEAAGVIGPEEELARDAWRQLRTQPVKLPVHWAVSSAVEHCLHTAGVTGSIPVPPTSRNKDLDCFYEWSFLLYGYWYGNPPRPAVTSQRGHDQKRSAIWR